MAPCAAPQKDFQPFTFTDINVKILNKHNNIYHPRKQRQYMEIELIYSQGWSIESIWIPHNGGRQDEIIW